MASKKVIENRRLLEQYLSHCDYGEGLALLYRNNYYLDDKKQDCYTRMFEISKDAVQLLGDVSHMIHKFAYSGEKLPSTDSTEVTVKK